MTIAVRANEQQKKEFLSKTIPDDIKISWLDEDDIPVILNADAYFDLLFDEDDMENNVMVEDIPVFANAVCCTCGETGKDNYFRINAWPGFLMHSIIEISCNGKCTSKKKAEEVLNKLGWKFTWVPNVAGLVSARIICMIINEAYYALQDDVSTKEDIDIAMKLGTNYPYGPFEWSKKLGLNKIHSLLNKLAETEPRYAPAPLLSKEAVEGQTVNY